MRGEWRPRDWTGAAFTVRLPLTDRDIPRQREPQRLVRPPLRILLVEDNADVATTYRSLLERRGDIVTVALTGHHALDAADRQPFDLVLCDLELGQGIDGYEVTRRLRRSPRYAKAHASPCQDSTGMRRGPGHGRLGSIFISRSRSISPTSTRFSTGWATNLPRRCDLDRPEPKQARPHPR